MGRPTPGILVIYALPLKDEHRYLVIELCSERDKEGNPGKGEDRQARDLIPLDALVHSRHIVIYPAYACSKRLRRSLTALAKVNLDRVAVSMGQCSWEDAGSCGRREHCIIGELWIDPTHGTNQSYHKSFPIGADSGEEANTRFVLLLKLLKDFNRIATNHTLISTLYISNQKQAA